MSKEKEKKPETPPLLDLRAWLDLLKKSGEEEDRFLGAWLEGMIAASFCQTPAEFWPRTQILVAWADRRGGTSVDSTPFLRAYEVLLVKFGTDYGQVRELYGESAVKEFFAELGFKVKSFDSIQPFDFAGLKGRTLSASYTPEPGQPNFQPMMEQLREIFDQYHADGQVAF